MVSPSSEIEEAAASSGSTKIAATTLPMYGKHYARTALEKRTPFFLSPLAGESTEMRARTIAAHVLCAVHEDHACYTLWRVQGQEDMDHGNDP
jgi:hypothetical protein